MFNTHFVPLGTAALCACLLSSVLLTGCGGGSSSTPTTPIVSANPPSSSPPLTTNGLQYTLSADKSLYNVGQAVNLTLKITNVGSQPVTEMVGNPNVIVTVMQGSQVIWQTPPATNSGAGAAVTSKSLEPGATLIYQATWPQTATLSGKQVASGIYIITAALNAANAAPATNSLQVQVAF